MRLPRLTMTCLLALAAVTSVSGAQVPLQTGPPAVYLDCRAHCDEDFVRTEITYVNWVRDREVADVQILITSGESGAGGEQITLAFIGLRGMAGRGDTLAYATNPTTTPDERRQGMTRTIALGLVPFVAHTTAGPALRITAGSGTLRSAEQQASAKSDPWNAWVFEVGISGFMNGERYYKSRDINMQLNSKRVTERWKTEIEYSFSYRDNQATVQEFDAAGLTVVSETTYTNVQRNWQAQWLQVKSMTDHFSLGTHIEVAQQTFRNQSLRYQLRGAFEYNIFPYSESTRRELNIRYGLGFTGYRYADTTIFNKITETLPGHFVEVGYRTKQPWGSGNVNIEHRNFLTDASKRTTEINGNFSVRLFKGLNLNAGGGYEWIRDQVYLPRGEQDAVDVLLRRRALLTGFRYFTHVGVGYTFGSIYNNVVNPRF